MTDQPGLELRLKALEEKFERLEAIESITQMMHKYGYMLDKGYYDDMPDMFVPEHVEVPEVYHAGCHYVGEKGIRRFYDYFKTHHGTGVNGPSPKQLFDHPVMQQVITLLPGNVRAFGRARILIQHATYKDLEGGPVQGWAAGLYENEYLRVEGQWRIRKLNISICWQTAFDEGWAMVEEKPLQLPPLYPEAPLGPDAHIDHGEASWPHSTATFPFHFAHPTTGKPIIDRLPVGQDHLPDLQ